MLFLSLAFLCFVSGLACEDVRVWCGVVWHVVVFLWDDEVGLGY